MVVMGCCCFHQPHQLGCFLVFDMNRFATAGVGKGCPLKLPLFSGFSRESRVVGFGFLSHRKDGFGLNFVAPAGFSSSFSLHIGLDTETLQSQDLSQFSWIGPIPGDIAEVEAYCRIFRAAEQLHISIMDTLCNPLTGECTVSYDLPSGEKSLLEDKLVAVLGCMVALLNKGRAEVLSGRSASMKSFQVADVNFLEDNLPPLATFRGEMKRCSESLHIALESYLAPSDSRSVDIWRKMQRLKNVCYDIGFPRRDDYPCQTVFANWRPVYLSTTKEDLASKDSEIAFWKGGQVTDEGLKWLIENGYKTIVDLRAEIVKDDFYQKVLENAILQGKIEVVKLPVEVGTAPSVEQVEKFASFVSDVNKKPLYLHSQEGVWRTSAMVSRWRQYMVRSHSQSVMNHPSISNENVLKSKERKADPQKSSEVKENIPLENTNGSLLESLSGTNSSNEISCEIVSLSQENKDNCDNGTCKDLIFSEDTTPTQVATVSRDKVGSTESFWRKIDPLKSQIPTCDVFSRSEMSRFLERRKISPPTFLDYEGIGSRSSPVSRESCAKIDQKSEISETSYISELEKEGNSRGTFHNKISYLEPKNSSSNGVYLDGDTSISISPNVNVSAKVGRHDGIENKTYTSASDNLERNVTSTAIKVNWENNLESNLTSTDVREDQMGNGKATTASVSDDTEIVEGNMCASTTGVVRVQSRKKAEMFLVRTDGFSCTREKVTESSLAFTHPSTQQQMLLWKSTPKTVLLLKKLGHELMEEAKEAASFLYYQEKMNVLVEPDVHDMFARIPGFGFIQTFYSQDTSDLHERVDFVACLGGDGVILHASNLFRGAVPPIVSFNLGSLGFLTSHYFEGYKKDLRQVIHGNNTSDGVYITLRMRLRCEIFRNGKAMPGKIFDVLNEVVVDRGSNPYLSKIECYEHDHLITKVHPNVPCILFTPICPHSLSFRPVILPDSAQLELKIPEDTRSNAWVSFDGKRRQQLSRGDSVRISMSEHPLPTINKSDQTGDWFRSLIRCLNWNERLDQKAL
ncbi:PREDICTED: NAD kinase 2, chloroplastic-like isoform X2 [Nelumbo nucifera]|uniref:NAD kinase 2, chloroplastic-like isoform X2 n=1 Tax=Nelumbo nucifera TaxID=4432 RepID=A0A1U8ARS6_NELNU|nr:PREDICTED: NAD kinase 2, chloroplastic-like isoform X2 [Nelumbo nucifera]